MLSSARATSSCGSSRRLRAEAAIIGVAEKGQADLEIVSNAGGHASSPAAQTSVTELAAAIEKISKHPLKGEFIEPIRGLFSGIRPVRILQVPVYLRESVAVRSVARQNLRKNRGTVLSDVPDNNGGDDAQGLRSCQRSSRLRQRHGRICGFFGQTVEEACDELARIGDENITIEILTDRPPTSVAPAEGHEWDTLVNVIRDTWIEAIPYMHDDGPDRLSSEKICDRIYRFSPYSLTHEDG